MEETEKLKTVKAKKSNSSAETQQIMTAIYSATLRGLIKRANEVGINRVDVVSIIKENGQFVLVYFK